MDIQKRYKKLVTHVESHASAVSLFKSGEQRYIKAISIKAIESDQQYQPRGGKPDFVAENVHLPLSNEAGVK